jgi:hypothetical protein
MTIFISGKYTGDTETNTAVARSAMWQLIRKGQTPFCPHTMTAGGETVDYLSYEDFMRIDLDWLSQCEAVLMLPGWQDSPGACREYEYAVKQGKTIYTSLDDVPDVL